MEFRVVRATASPHRRFSGGCATWRPATCSWPTRTRQPDGGRKRAIDRDPTLLQDWDALVEPTAPGDPDSPLRWTCLSARPLAVALDGQGDHGVADVVGAIGLEPMTSCV